MEPFSFPPLDQWILVVEKLHHILDVDSRNISPSEEPCPIPPDCCHLTVALCHKKNPTALYNGSCFRTVSSMVSPVDSIIMGPLLHLSICEANSLVRSSIVWNTMMMVFCKSTDSGFSISITCSKANP